MTRTIPQYQNSEIGSHRRFPPFFPLNDIFFPRSMLSKLAHIFILLIGIYFSSLVVIGEKEHLVSSNSFSPKISYCYFDEGTVYCSCSISKRTFFVVPYCCLKIEDMLAVNRINLVSPTFVASFFSIPTQSVAIC